MKAFKVIRKNREILVYRPNNGKLLFQFERGGQGAFPDNGFAARLILGNGAGYKGGRTAYLAFNSGSRLWSTRYRGDVRNDGRSFGWFTKLTKIEFGITRNANIVPYLSH